MAKKRKRPGIIFVKTATGMVPVSAYDAERYDEYSLGVEFDVTPRIRRSLPLHRTYWKALSEVVAATGIRPTAEKLHDALVWDLGYIGVETDFAGKPRLVRDSTSFEAMTTDDEFRPYFDLAMGRLTEVVGYDVLKFLDDKPQPKRRPA